MAGALRVGRKLNRAVNDNRVQTVKQELDMCSVDVFCERRLFGDEFPFPSRLIEALVYAPLVDEADL